MKFLRGVCHHCNGELQIPENLDTIICMYCGKEFSVRDALTQKEEPDRPEKVADETVSEALHSLLYDIENPIQNFKKPLYMDSFQKYVSDHAKDLAILEQAYLASDEPECMMERVAEPFAADVENDLNSRPGRKREGVLMDYNLSMVVYVFPALLETDDVSGQAWIDALVSGWKKHFPKTDLKAATAREINDGFRYKFCYITTAVCMNRHKPDDCYELSLLRSFRDDYLLQSAEGEKMVHEYYDVAPSIVKHIDRREDAGAIYEGIWQQYISPCIRLIESDQKEACVDLYKHMVYELRDLYFH